MVEDVRPTWAPEPRVEHALVLRDVCAEPGWVKGGTPRADIDRVRALSLRRDGTCVDCGTALPAGTPSYWDATTCTVHCAVCVDGSAADSTAGASARREHERRRAKREDRVRARHPRIGGFLLAVTSEPTSTRVWEQGAAGEEAVGAVLDALPDVLVLHDRRMVDASGRLTRANVDHLVVAPSGVWVVDAKTHHGALQVRRSGGILSPRHERLFINNRDRTNLLDGLHGQVQTVQQVLDRAGWVVTARGALCFVGTTLPWLEEQIAAVPLVGRRGLKKLLNRPGDLGFEERGAIAAHLADRFRPPELKVRPGAGRLGR